MFLFPSTLTALPNLNSTYHTEHTLLNNLKVTLSLLLVLHRQFRDLSSHILLPCSRPYKACHFHPSHPHRNAQYVIRRGLEPQLNRSRPVSSVSIRQVEDDVAQIVVSWSELPPAFVDGEADTTLLTSF